eukprot:UN03119
MNKISSWDTDRLMHFETMECVSLLNSIAKHLSNTQWYLRKDVDIILKTLTLVFKIIHANFDHLNSDKRLCPEKLQVLRDMASLKLYLPEFIFVYTRIDGFIDIPKIRNIRYNFTSPEEKSYIISMMYNLTMLGVTDNEILKKHVELISRSKNWIL